MKKVAILNIEYIFQNIVAKNNKKINNEFFFITMIKIMLFERYNINSNDSDFIHTEVYKEYYKKNEFLLSKWFNDVFNINFFTFEEQCLDFKIELKYPLLLISI